MYTYIYIYVYTSLVSTAVPGAYCNNSFFFSTQARELAFNTNIFIYMYICKYVYVYIHVYMFISIYMYIYLFIYIHNVIIASSFQHKRVNSPVIHAHIDIYTYI
jgi:hypothetical protein